MDRTLEQGHIVADRYRIEACLGQGGMGGVYLATHTALNTRVALKRLKLSWNKAERQEAAVRQFMHEARILTGLRHPGLPQVHDFFEDDGHHYLVMDFIAGRDLARIVDDEDEPLPVRMVMDWGVQLCRILEYLHGQTPPVVFRDLKPSNVMLDTEGRIRLVDFGIAKTHSLNGTGTATSLRGSGTYGFAAPEQFKGSTTPQSDLYSLGATLYAVLTATVPLPAGLHAQLADVPSLHALRPDVPPPLEALIIDLMRADPAARPPSAAAVRTTLQGLMAGQSQPSPGSVAPAPRPRTVKAALYSIAVLCLALGGWWAFKASAPAAPPAIADDVGHAAWPVPPSPSASPAPARTSPSPTPARVVALSPPPEPSHTAATTPTPAARPVVATHHPVIVVTTTPRPPVVLPPTPRVVVLTPTLSPGPALAAASPSTPPPPSPDPGVAAVQTPTPAPTPVPIRTPTPSPSSRPAVTAALPGAGGPAVIRPGLGVGRYRLGDVLDGRGLASPLVARRCLTWMVPGVGRVRTTLDRHIIFIIATQGSTADGVGVGTPWETVRHIFGDAMLQADVRRHHDVYYPAEGIGFAFHNDLVRAILVLPPNSLTRWEGWFNSDLPIVPTLPR